MHWSKLNLLPRSSAVLASTLALALAFPGAQAMAAGRVGTGTPASCTRGAFNEALAGGGTVSFNCGPNPHTISFTLSKHVVVDTTIDGGGRITLRALDTHHFTVKGRVTLRLQDLELSGGSGTVAGAIDNQGTLIANRVTFSDNSSTDKGGAIFNRGTLTLVECAFLRNEAAKGGGAIWTVGGTVTADACTFDQNLSTGAIGIVDQGGGAIGVFGGAITVKNGTFVDNASSDGGALMNRATATVETSTFSGNEAQAQGGAIQNLGGLTVHRCTLSGNQAGVGGGIFHLGSSLGVSESTLSGNSAQGSGGGVFAFAGISFVNTTLSGNQAGASGGGLFARDGGSSLNFVTIANNVAISGAGIQFDRVLRSELLLQLSNSVLANNTTGNCDGDPRVTSGGHNLSTDTNCQFVLEPGDQEGVDAKLGPLANNGGPTRTHQPLATSPAIDTGVMVPGIDVDQRGFRRPFPAGGRPDKGSVEVQPRP